MRGLARGLLVNRAPRPLRELRGLRHDPRLHDSAAHQVARGGDNLSWREPISSFNILLTSTAWRNDHNGFSHRRAHLPAPDANTLLACADHCLRSRNYVNLIAIDKQPQLQWLDMDTAIEHLAIGAPVWEWASNVPEGEQPDIVLGCAGEIPTLEIVAAAHWLRENAPGSKVRGSVLRAGWR